MASVSKPRCARGQRCVHVRQLGSEGPPTVSNQGDLCERCGKAAPAEQEANQARLQVAAARKKAESDTVDWIYQIRQKEAELAAGVAIKQGAIWEAVRGVRERWQIEAQTQIPRPISPGAYYVPAQLAQEPQRVDAGYEEWADRLSEWDGELLTLYTTFIPEDCRESVGPDALNWLAFLSGIVLYDPPIADRPDMPGLPDFCNAFSGSPRVGLRLMAQDGSTVPDPAMALGPFSLVRDRQ